MIDPRTHCPRCGQSSMYLNYYKTHWGICHKCGIRWPIGSNVFSSWRNENREQWEHNAKILLKLEVIDALDEGTYEGTRETGGNIEE